MLPFNIAIPHITKQTVANLAHVSSSDIFDGGSKTFHPDGLFSIEKFGRIGEERRSTQLGYINVKVKIFHPKIFDVLKRLKGLYAGILEGKRYALWDAELKDFVSASDFEGETGASFFMRHWKELTLQRNRSTARNQRIDVIEKYRAVALSEYVLVLPAGLRDVEMSDDGRTEEDEINTFYRKLITVARTVTDTSLGMNSPVLDATRASLQKTFNEIYDYLFSMLKGKSGFIQSKFTTRRLFYGTANVITAMDTSPQILGDANSPSVNDSMVGLFQTMRGTLPITVSKLLQYTEGRFNRQSGSADLYDPKTLKKVTVRLKSEDIDRFSTVEGMDKFINLFKIRGIRHQPVRVDNLLLGLIYVDDDSNFMHVDDIDSLPEHLDRKYVRGITFTELFYLTGYRHWRDTLCFITRFPITGEGSMYPSSPYVMTTIRSEVRHELGLDGQRLGDEYVAACFPDRSDDRFMESLSPHTSRLSGLGGDFDGDRCSADFAMSEEAKQEKLTFFRQKRAYVSADGRLRTTIGADVLKITLHNLTHERVSI